MSFKINSTAINVKKSFTINCMLVLLPNCNGDQAQKTRFIKTGQKDRFFSFQLT